MDISAIGVLVNLWYNKTCIRSRCRLQESLIIKRTFVRVSFVSRIEAAHLCQSGRLHFISASFNLRVQKR